MKLVTENIPYQTQGNESSTLPAELVHQVNFRRAGPQSKLGATKSTEVDSMQSNFNRLSELTIENVMTNGIRANGRVIFEFRLSGVDVYDMLKLFEQAATRDDKRSFLEVRKCTFLHEKIFKQARRQGF